MQVSENGHNDQVSGASIQGDPLPDPATLHARGKGSRKGRRTPDPAYLIAAARIGAGERPCDVARDMDLDAGRLSQLKWGTDPTARQYQRALKDANDRAIALATTAALGRLLRILDLGNDRDAAAAAREVANLQKNLASLRTDLARVAIEQDRLDLQRQQVQAITDAAAAGPIGLVYLPGKDAAT